VNERNRNGFTRLVDDITKLTILEFLIDKMQAELIRRRRDGYMIYATCLQEVKASDMLKLAETAMIDSLILLPDKLLDEEKDLVNFITITFSLFSEIFKEAEFINYSPGRAQNLLKPIRLYINSLKLKNVFTFN